MGDVGVRELSLILYTLHHFRLLNTSVDRATLML
jgi:hypothetical protein